MDDIKRIGTEWNGIEWNKREGLLIKAQQPQKCGQTPPKWDQLPKQCRQTPPNGGRAPRKCGQTPDKRGHNGMKCNEIS